MPDDYEYGSGDGDQGFAFAPTLDQAPVAFGQERALATGDGGRRDTERALEVRIALAGFARGEAGTGLDGARTQLRPGHQMTRGGEPGHVQADLRDDQLRGLGVDTRNLGQAPPGMHHLSVAIA